MKLKQLLEAYKLLEDVKYADISVEELYNTIFPKNFGSISFEEINKILDFLNIDETNTEEEIRAKRNTVVKYWRDNKISNSKSKEEFKKNQIFDDQMSAFTGAIDYFLDKHGFNV